MPDSSIHSALFSLVRAGIWNQTPQSEGFEALHGEDWQKIYTLARQQTVTGLVGHAVCLLPDEVMPPEPLLMRWVAEMDRIEQRNRMMNRGLAALGQTFQRQGLKPVLLKGQGVASFYAHPLLRECGDIDFYFPEEQQQLAIELIRNQGISVAADPDGSWSYTWRLEGMKEGIVVEHHPQVLDIYNPFKKSVIASLLKAQPYSKFQLPNANEATLAIPAPMVNLLLLNTHIMKHALGKGIGIRQICDMACACHELYSEVDTEEMKAWCQKLGVERWSGLLHAFLVEQLGVPVEELPFKNKASSSLPLLEVVLRGGNFGHYAGGGTRCKGKVWTRKWHTAQSFVQNMRFSWKYAPGEAFWIFSQLIRGQF